MLGRSLFVFFASDARALSFVPDPTDIIVDSRHKPITALSMKEETDNSDEKVAKTSMSETDFLFNQQMAIMGILPEGKLDEICRFSDPAMPWAAHRAGANLTGDVSFTATAGQGIANNFAGLTAAVLSSVVFHRRIHVRWGFPDEDLLPLHPEGPYPSTAPPPCHAQCMVRLHDFGQSTSRQVVEETMQDAKTCPTVCVKANFGAMETVLPMVADRGFKPSYPFMGCAFHYLYDIKRSTGLTAPRDGLHLVGHLRQHGPVTPKFLQCAQHIATQKMAASGGTPAWGRCSITVVSDTDAVKDFVRGSTKSGPCDLYATDTVAKNSKLFEGDQAKDFLELIAADVTLTTQSGFGEAASAFGPDLLDMKFSDIDKLNMLMHHYKFDELVKQHAGRNRADDSDLCRLDI